MKRFTFFLLAICCLMHSGAIAQPVWQKILGGSKTDEANAVLTTADGHLLVGGSTESLGLMDDREGYLAKLAMDGSALWENTYNFESFWNPITDIIELPSGNFVAIGKTWADLCPNGQNYIFECNPQGDTLWTKGICGTQYTFSDCLALAATPDGGFAICGRGSLSDITIFKTDHLGNIEWEQALVNDGWEHAYNIIVTQDGNLVVGSFW